MGLVRTGTELLEDLPVTGDQNRPLQPGPRRACHRRQHTRPKTRRPQANRASRPSGTWPSPRSTHPSARSRRPSKLRASACGAVTKARARQRPRLSAQVITVGRWRCGPDDRIVPSTRRRAGRLSLEPTFRPTLACLGTGGHRPVTQWPEPSGFINGHAPPGSGSTTAFVVGQVLAALSRWRRSRVRRRRSR